jgi:hypothetical protein
MPIPLPLILDDAGVSIGDGAVTEVFTELACVTNHLEIMPDTAVTELTTMCGAAEYPGVTKWALVLTLYQSYEPAATDEALSAAVAADKPVGFKVLPYKSLPVSATNPLYTGMVMPKPYPPVNGDAGEASTIELEWSITEGPTKEITGTYPVAQTQEATEKKKS